MSQLDKELIWEMHLPVASMSVSSASMTNIYVKRRQELILVVDDDPCVKDVTRDILERYGHSVLTASSRGAALECCEQRGRELAIVLLDETVLEPDIAGVLRRITEMNPAIKVIITSIYSSGWNPSRVQESGAAGFLRKPYRMTDLLKMVEQVQQIQ